MKRKNPNEKIELTFRSESAWNVEKLEVHDYYELNLAMSNAGKFFIEGKVYDLKKGTLFAINNVLLHRNVSDNINYPRYIIKFMPEILEKYHTQKSNLFNCFFKSSPSIILNDEQINTFVDLYRKMENVKNSDEFGNDILLLNYLSELLIYVNKVYDKYDFETSRLNTTSNNISDILKYINDNSTEQLSLSSISKKFYMSKSHLCSIFKSSVGLSVNDYIIQSRLLNAKQLMETCNNLLEVCEKSGFNSYTSFARNFKNITGLSPNEYRRKIGK